MRFGFGAANGDQHAGRARALQKRTDIRGALWLLAGLTLSVPGALAETIVARQTDPPRGAADRIPDTATAARLARDGQRLSAEQAKVLEVRLETAPDDLPARARLLGYYFATGIKVAGRRRHALHAADTSSG